MMKAGLNFRKILKNGFVRVILGVTVMVIVLLVVKYAITFLLSKTALNADVIQFTSSALSALAVIITYKYFFQIYEKRSITELSTLNLFRDLLSGVFLGALLQTLTISVIYLNKGYHIISINKATEVLPWMGLSLSAAIGEEIVFRGIIFRITEEKLGSYWALTISSLFFGAAHFFNPGATILSSIGITIQAGLLLGTAYMITRNIWLPIAIHFSWDFVQAGIYGVTTSGNEIGKSLFKSKIVGPEIITGGKFGPEASIQATIFCFAAAVLLFIISYKHKGIIKPYWSLKSSDI